MRRFLPALLCRAAVVLPLFFSAHPAGAFSLLAPPPAPHGLPLVLIQATGPSDPTPTDPTPTDPTPTDPTPTDPTPTDTGPTAGCQTHSCDHSANDPVLPPPPKGVPADAVGITPQNTAAIVALVDEANRYCREHYDRRYVIDCIARAYVRIGQSLPFRGGYGGVRIALMNGGTALHELAIKNTDPTQPAKTGPTGRGTPSAYLRPVVQSPAVLKAAGDIIEGTQLVLLRSAAGSAQRHEAYTQVANVVGSTVVLLRSGRRKKRKDRARQGWLAVVLGHRPPEGRAGPA